ncbi:unnamed protein product [Arctia plantaginis]|uniref:Uncharacterized protein n=1 Tax=Arctia plantaginis TaxID=874455 RepID=A0A8S1AWJ2_ARCPL|nr:unnamed protein product [Arctia plantaginis]
MGTRCRRVVVQLAQRGLRDELLRARRDVTSADLNLDRPPRRFYLNKRLTRSKQLFFVFDKLLLPWVEVCVDQTP